MPGHSSAALLILLLLAAEQRKGRLSRIASRATGAVVDTVDPDVIIDRVDVDAIVQRIDVNALVERIDLDALVSRIDVQEIAARIDVDEILASVDFDAVIKQVDLDAAVARVDVNALLEQVDVNELLDRVEVDHLLDRVDVDRLLDRVDVDRLLDRVDVNRLMDRVDVDRLMDRADIEAIVERAGIPEIVAESTGHLTGSLLDVVRRQMVALDQIIGRLAYRLTGRDPAERPAAPAALLGLEGSTGITSKGRGQVTGHYAGPVTRLAAYAIDAFVMFWSFTLLFAGVRYVASLVGITPDTTNLEIEGLVGLGLFGVWALLYWWIGLSLTGKTVGKGVIGLKVVADDGDPITGRKALLRTLMMPVSFALFGVGLLGVLFGRYRRTLHDLVAGTAEVYDWGDRPADVPAPLTRWIEKRTEGPIS